MKHVAFPSVLLLAGLLACSRGTTDPSQANTPSVATNPSTGGGVVSANDPGSVDQSGDCEQTGEHTGQCGSQNDPGEGHESESPGGTED
jgi:hypothetical protein